MFEIVTILGLIYLLYRIRFFYKEGNYNQVKGFVSILIFIITVLVLKHYMIINILLLKSYNISLVVKGLYSQVTGLLYINLRYTDC